MAVSFPTRGGTISVQRYVLLLTVCAATIAFGAAPSSATFPGEDGRIAFDAFRPKTGSVEIFTAGSDGSDVQKLTSDPNHFSVLPDWSPDGQRIAFTRAVFVGGSLATQIYVMNADGSALAKLTRGPGVHAAPSWSPDGSTLAIRSAWGAGHALQGIWIIPASDPDGVTEEEAERVTTIPAGAKFDSEPQYSPDGSSIVFTRFKSLRRSAIHRVNIDGTGLERLTRWRLNTSNPDWSPDGQSIAFDSGDSATPGSKADIYVIRADGSGRTRLTDRPRLHEGERFDGANNPCWSPSGTQIMYTHFLPNEFGALVAMNADGSDKHVVIDQPRFANKVDWGTHP